MYTIKNIMGGDERTVGTTKSLEEATIMARESLTSREFPGRVFDGPAWVEKDGNEVARFRGISDAPGFERVVEED